MNKICVIGLGNMGKPVFDVLSAKKLYEMSGCGRGDNKNEALKDVDVLIIAVKPQKFDELAEEISIDLSDKLAISVMAGVSIKKIRETLGCERVVRVMPNLPIKVGAGVCGWYGNGLNENDEKLVKQMLEIFGVEVELTEEAMMDPFTAVCGCAPAYYYMLNRALKMKALDLGFSDEDASKMVKGIFLGSAKLLESGEGCSGELIKRIASKGGSTEAALASFEEAGFDKIVSEAVDAACNKAKKIDDES